METQNLTRSCNEALLLAAIAEGPKHGYQLALDIEKRSGGYFKFKHGTLYPILHRMEKDGLISGEWSEEGPRGKRKRYVITAKGEGYAGEQRASWLQFIGSFTAAIGEATA